MLGGGRQDPEQASNSPEARGGGVSCYDPLVLLVVIAVVSLSVTLLKPKKKCPVLLCKLGRNVAAVNESKIRKI